MSSLPGVPGNNVQGPNNIKIGDNNGQPPLQPKGGNGQKPDTIDPNGKSAWTELMEIAQTIYDFVVGSLSNLSNWVSYISTFFFPGISFEQKTAELRDKFNKGGNFEKLQILLEVASLQYEKVKVKGLFDQLIGSLDQKVKDGLALGAYGDDLTAIEKPIRTYLATFAQYALNKGKLLQAKPEPHNQINALRCYQRAVVLAGVESPEVIDKVNEEFTKTIDNLAPEVKKRIFCSQFYQDCMNFDVERFTKENADDAARAQFNELGLEGKNRLRSIFFNDIANATEVDQAVNEFFTALKVERTTQFMKTIIDLAYFSDHEIINKQFQKAMQCQKDLNEEGAKKALSSLILNNRFTIGNYLYNEFRTLHTSAKIKEDVSDLEVAVKELNAVTDFETKRRDFAEALYLKEKVGDEVNAKNYFDRNSRVIQYLNRTTNKQDVTVALYHDKLENKDFNDFILNNALVGFMIENWNNASFIKATETVFQELTQPLV